MHWITVFSAVCALIALLYVIIQIHYGVTWVDVYKYLQLNPKDKNAPLGLAIGAAMSLTLLYWVYDYGRLPPGWFDTIIFLVLLGVGVSTAYGTYRGFIELMKNVEQMKKEEAAKHSKL